MQVQVSAEVESLRNKPLGDAALELLIALNEGEIDLVTTARNNDNDRFTASIYSVKNNEYPKNAITTNTMLRLKAVMTTLVRREYISSQELKDYLNGIETESLFSQDHLKNVKTKLKRDSNLWRMENNYYIVNRWGINQAGIQALLNMRNRVDQMKNAVKNRYVITARVKDEVRLPGVGGIYLITKETAANVFISTEKIDGVMPFSKDRALQTVKLGKQEAGSLVPRANVLVMDATPQMFNDMLQQTRTYLEKVNDNRTELDNKIEQLKAQSELDTTAMGTELNVYIQNSIEEKARAEQTVQEELDQGIPMELDDLDDLPGFKP